MDPEKSTPSFGTRVKSDLKVLSKTVEKNATQFLNKPLIKRKVDGIKKFYHNQTGNDGSDKGHPGHSERTGENCVIRDAERGNTASSSGTSVLEHEDLVYADTLSATNSNTSDDSWSDASVKDVSCYSSSEYDEVLYEIPNYEIEDKIQSVTIAPSESSPPCLPPPNLPPRHSFEASPKVYPTDTKTFLQIPARQSVSSRSSSPISVNIPDSPMSTYSRQSSSDSIPPPILPKNSPLSWQSSAPTIQSSSPEKINNMSQQKTIAGNGLRKLSPNIQLRNHEQPSPKTASKKSESNAEGNQTLPWSRPTSQVLKSKMVRMAKTLKGSLNPSKSPGNDSLNTDVSRKHEDTPGQITRSPDRSSTASGSSRRSRKSDASIARPSSELVQKLESTLRNIPSLMIFNDAEWIQNEQLYQHYAATANHTQTNNDGEAEEDIYDIYEEWPEWPEGNYYNCSPIDQRPVNAGQSSDGSGRRREQSTSGIMLTENMTARTLWKDLPVVQLDPTALSLSKEQRTLQEIKFEILTTEASYIKSLKVLQEHFISSPELSRESVLSENDRKSLFHEIRLVHECSVRFMADLETCWGKSIFLQGIFEMLLNHSKEHFHVYVTYCAQQSMMAETYKKLMELDGAFSRAVKRLESQPGSCMLPLHSFLLLPMQRITRLLLLVENALQCMDMMDDERYHCQLSRNLLKQIVHDCNEEARKATRRLERMENLGQKLQFLTGVKPFSMTPASRWLIMSGDMTKYDWKTEESTFSLRRNKYKPTYKINKSTVRLILLSDLLVLTKKEGDESCTVLDYALRSMVRAEEGKNVEYLPRQVTMDAIKKYTMVIAMWENHEHKYSEMVLSCSLPSDRERWLEALAPNASKDFLLTTERKTPPKLSSSTTPLINGVLEPNAFSDFVQTTERKTKPKLSRSPVIHGILPNNFERLTAMDSKRDDVYENATSPHDVSLIDSLQLSTSELRAPQLSASQLRASQLSASQLSASQLHAQNIREIHDMFAN